MKIPGFAAVLVLAVFAAPVLAADQGKDEQWSVTMNMAMTQPMAMSMPAMTHTVCTPAGADQGEPPMDPKAECKVDSMKKSGTRTDFRITCNMQGASMVGEGWTDQTDKNHYKGEFKVSGETSGMPMAMTMKYTGERIGSCTAAES